MGWGKFPTATKQLRMQLKNFSFSQGMPLPLHTGFRRRSFSIFCDILSQICNLITQRNAEYKQSHINHFYSYYQLWSKWIFLFLFFTHTLIPLRSIFCVSINKKLMVKDCSRKLLKTLFTVEKNRYRKISITTVMNWH